MTNDRVEAGVGWSVADHRRAALAGVTARQRIEDALARLADLDDPAVLIGGPLVESALADADRLDALDPADLALHGIPFVVKDNIDVAGVPTTAACPGFAYVPARDATAVARLRAAGAVVVAKTNLDQFATGLVGTRSPHGTPRNPYDATVVPGGSSSGSAVAVARGLVPFALGTDTAGSGRVPASLCGIVGFKGTLGRVSTAGVVPAVRRIDCTTVFASTVTDAALVMGIVGGFDETDPWSRRAPVRTARPLGPIGVPDGWRDGWPDGCLDDETTALYRDALERLDSLGHPLVPIDLSPFLEAGGLLYGGPIVAERFVAVGGAIAAHRADADPTVAGIITAGAGWSASDAYETEYRLAALRRAVEPVFAAVDALAIPTTPGIARLAEVAHDPRGANERLGRLTTFANLLDLACVAFPMGMRTDGVPAGLQLIGPAWSDDALAAAAARFLGEAAVPPPTLPAPAEVPFVVVGAHLAGQPLNGQLTERGGRLVGATTTAPAYRLYALAEAVPPKPALVRDEQHGAAISVEVWAMPVDQLGSFLTLVPPPLCLGTLELADGSWCKGFLAEPRATEGATEITHHGGWVAYRRTQAAANSA
jgi:allophanate hydrolase